MFGLIDSLKNRRWKEKEKRLEAFLPIFVFFFNSFEIFSHSRSGLYPTVSILYYACPEYKQEIPL